MPKKKKAEKSAKDKPVLSKLGQWGLAVLLSVLLMLLFAFLLGRHRIANEGYPDKDGPIDAFLAVRNGEDVSSLQYAMFHGDKNADDILESIRASIESDPGFRSMDIQSTERSFAQVEPGDKTVSSLGFEPSSMAMCTLRVPISRTYENGAYETSTEYFVSVYELGKRWYLFDAVKGRIDVLSGTDENGNQADLARAYQYFNNAYYGGDTDMGIIRLDESWHQYWPDQPASMENAEVIQELHYMEDSDSAAIHMLRMKTDSTIGDIAIRMAENLSSDESPVKVVSEKSELAGYPAIRTEFYAEKYGLWSISWLVDTEAYDDTVRYLSVDCTEEYLSSEAYLTSLTLFVLPEK